MSSLIKKLLSIAICISLIVTCAVVSLAQESSDSQNYSVILDGKTLDLDQTPINVDGNILVPMRDIFKACGAEITWVEKTRTVYAKGKNNVTIELKIGSDHAYINGDEFKLNVPATIYNNRTMVPVRFVAEALGATVDWVAPNVVITTNLSSAQYITIPMENIIEENDEPSTQPVEVTNPIATETKVSEPVVTPTVNNVSTTTTTTTENKEQTNEVKKTYESAIYSCADYVLTNCKYYNQDGIKGACYITSLGMIATNLTGAEWSAEKVYKINNCSVIGGTETLFANLGIKRDKRIYFSANEKSVDKVKKVVELLKQNPEGVIVKFESTSTTHFIVVVGIKDGKLIVNDPADLSYVSLDKAWTGRGMFSSYDEAIANMVLVEYFSKA